MSKQKMKKLTFNGLNYVQYLVLYMCTSAGQARAKSCMLQFT